MNIKQLRKPGNTESEGHLVAQYRKRTSSSCCILITISKKALHSNTETGKKHQLLKERLKNWYWSSIRRKKTFHLHNTQNRTLHKRRVIKSNLYSTDRAALCIDTVQSNSPHELFSIHWVIVKEEWYSQICCLVGTAMKKQCHLLLSEPSEVFFLPPAGCPARPWQTLSSVKYFINVWNSEWETGSPQTHCK